MGGYLMSHNIITVDSTKPSSLSAYTITLEALKRVHIGRGESDDYDQSAASGLSDSILYFYDTSPVNQITGATLSGANDWYSSVSLPAGRYLVRCGFDVTFTASGQFAYQIFNGTSYIGNRAQIGDTLQYATESAVGSAYAIFNSASSMTVSVKTPTGNTNLATIANQNSLPAERSYLSILEIS